MTAMHEFSHRDTEGAERFPSRAHSIRRGSIRIEPVQKVQGRSRAPWPGISNFLSSGFLSKAFGHDGSKSAFWETLYSKAEFFSQSLRDAERKRINLSKTKRRELCGSARGYVAQKMAFKCDIIIIYPGLFIRFRFLQVVSLCHSGPIQLVACPQADESNCSDYQWKEIPAFFLLSLPQKEEKAGMTRYLIDYLRVRL